MRNDSVIDNGSASAFIAYQRGHHQKMDALAVKSEITGHGNTIIDFGCGFGSLERMISGKAKIIYAIDKSKELIDYARRNNRDANVKFINADVADYKARRSSADYCIMLFSIHHTVDKCAWLKKAHYALKKGGKLLMVERICPNRLAWLLFPLYWFMFYKRKHEWSEGMPHLFHKAALLKNLAESNFELRSIKSLSYGDTDRFKKSLFPRKLIVAEKIRKSNL